MTVVTNLLRVVERDLRLLEDEAVKKYGSMGYKCVDVCGDPLDKCKVPLLAEKALKIIREAQNAGNLIYTVCFRWLYRPFAA